ncbi:MAG: RNase adapter RapZ [Rhodobacteraceae bacterium]|nr:RNase adapter RapZ [Paracoccaceae bacterium]
MHRLVFVTGPSGAGRSTTVRAFEDMDFEVIDNLPLRLVTRLIEGTPSGRPIVLGLDVRNRDFNATALIELIDTLTRNPQVALEVLYLDCAPSELIRRYSETRRRHPLAPFETPTEGIAREIDLLMPVRVRADHLIDTTELSVHDLKAEIARLFGRNTTDALAVSLQSFSYRRGVPRGVDMIFDCRFLANPHWVPALRGRDGRDGAVADYVRADGRFEVFFEKVRDLILFLLPAHLGEGKAHLTIGFGCTGGQHRSVAMVEMLGTSLAEAGWTVSRRHRELERRSAGATLAGADGVMQP